MQFQQKGILGKVCGFPNVPNKDVTCAVMKLAPFHGAQ